MRESRRKRKKKEKEGGSNGESIMMESSPNSSGSYVSVSLSFSPRIFGKEK